jgi:hypothetical protein
MCRYQLTIAVHLSQNIGIPGAQSLQYGIQPRSVNVCGSCSSSGSGMHFLLPL